MSLTDKKLHLDFIGDIHGYGSVLDSLLEKLGYSKNNSSFEHSQGRRVVFLGDYIDRGPEVEKTLQTVRSMVESGNALAIMGNHEYNAVCFHTPDRKGDYLRSHKEGGGKNIRQHQATLDQFAHDTVAWDMWIEWLKTLPFYLECGDWRAVHASWDFNSLKRLKGKSLLDEDFLYSSADPSSLDFRAVENVLKGLEVQLPEGVTFEDQNGNLRSEIRVRWWEVPNGGSYRDIVFPESLSIPDVSVSIVESDEWRQYPKNDSPVFFGHYWIPAKKSPEPVAVNAACLDYSVASPEGKLTAYRWDGESELDKEKFVQVCV
jgi:hypothetical protein